MPSVKKNEKNAFSFYMDEFIPRLREEGININHKQEAVPHLLAEWKALPKEEKFPYEEMAREWKIENHGRNARPDHEKLDCFGIPVINHEAQEHVLKDMRPEEEQRTRDFALAFLRDEVEILLISYQSAFEDPDELGYMPVEVCLMSYKYTGGITEQTYHCIFNSGSPPYGMKAECRQFAIQTHHIDPISPQYAEELDRYMLDEDSVVTKVWMNLIDATRKSQIKNQDDEKYLFDSEAGNFKFTVFSTGREVIKNEGCIVWLQTEFIEEGLLVNNAENSIYWAEFHSPLSVTSLIQEFYAIKNEELPDEQQVEIPTETQIQRDVDRPLNNIHNPTRCGYHEEIDCDKCSKMECHRAVYAISKHLRKLNYELVGDHFPENEKLIVGPKSKSEKFIYEPTENQKAYERKQRKKELGYSNQYNQNSQFGYVSNWLTNSSSYRDIREDQSSYQEFEETMNVKIQNESKASNLPTPASSVISERSVPSGIQNSKIKRKITRGRGKPLS